jgi:hypothetical protein
MEPATPLPQEVPSRPARYAASSMLYLFIQRLQQSASALNQLETLLHLVMAGFL